MKPLLAFVLATMAALLGNAQPLAVGDVRVSTTLVQSGAPLAADIKILGRDDGSRVVEIRLTNRSGRDVDLSGAEVTLPWAPSSGPAFRVAAGAMSSGRWPPTLIFDPAKDRTEPVSGMYLLARRDNGYALAAFVSWQTFWSKLHYRAGTLVMTADGEGRRIRAGETVALEKIRLTDGADWQDLLVGYGDAIARELRFTPKPPRPFVGWSTWDYYGRDFGRAAVQGNVAVLQKILPNANLVQLDGGWWRDRGDYGGVREDLGPDAMKNFAADFRARRLTAGVHIDGVRFSPESVIAREHPEYFLHDERGELLREQRSVNGQILHLFVDYSHPGACAYLRDMLHRLRREWGFDYFKIDFLRSCIAEDVRRDAFGNDSTRRIVPFDRGLTSVERFHRAMAAFREGMGDDAYLVGCSTPFGPTLGHVDALRTGPDISPKFAAYATQSEANAGNFYLHGKVAYADADYEVVRAKEDQDATLVKDRNKDGGDLTLNEAEMWTDYVALFSSTKIASDNLMILREERKALVRFAATQPSCSRFVPLDFWQHARARTDPFHVFLGEAGRDVFLAVFNWTDAPRTYASRGLPEAAVLAHGCVRGIADVAAADGVTGIALAARHAVIFRLPAGTDFDHARKAIRFD
jgi:alpha-galactosidase